jgi:hypothetical protein
MANKYVTPEGAGNKDGSDWDNAFGAAEFYNDYITAVAAGDIYYLFTGTYTYTGGANFRAFATGTYAAPIQLIGIKNQETMAVADTESNAPSLVLGAYYLYFTQRSSQMFSHVKVTGTGGAVLYGAADSSGSYVFYRCWCINTSTAASKYCFTFNNQIYYCNIIECYAKTSGSSGYAIYNDAQYSSVIGCVAEAGNGADGIYSRITCEQNIAINCFVGIFFSISLGASNHSNTIINCTDGVRSTSQLVLGVFRNFLFFNCTNAFNFTSTTVTPLTNKFLNNNFYNCANKLVFKGVNSPEYLDSSNLELDPQFIDANNGNFGIGANLRNKGFPSAFPNIPTISYMDIGAVQASLESSHCS